MTPKKSHLEKTLESAQAENKTLRAKLGHPEPAPSTSRRTPAQQLEAARIEQAALKSKVAANTPPPEPAKPPTRLQELAAKYSPESLPTGADALELANLALAGLAKKGGGR